MDFYKKIPRWLKNKYILTLVCFVIWIVFFDHNDLFLQVERTSELRQLEKGKAYYQEQIDTINRELSGLKNDPASVERIAREHFLMKKDNEEIFVIEEK
jgi:cell division protein FtsB